MTVQVWIGTPSEMGKDPVASKETQAQAVKWARDHLEGMKVMARKYDSGALAAIEATRNELTRTPTLTKGKSASWSFPYVGVTYRIELRST